MNEKQSQAARFRETARELGADDDKLKRLAKQKPNGDDEDKGQWRVRYSTWRKNMLPTMRRHMMGSRRSRQSFRWQMGVASTSMAKAGMLQTLASIYIGSLVKV
jgi:hypothetical protein